MAAARTKGSQDAMAAMGMEATTNRNLNLSIRRMEMELMIGVAKTEVEIGYARTEVKPARTEF